MFIAKLSERQNCWRILEDFHCQEYISFFDINCGLFMRLHFTIGCYDCRWTSRRRQSIQFSRILIMCIDAPKSTTNPLSSCLRVDGASKHLFSEGEKNAVLSFSFNLRYFWPTSTLLHRPIACAILSLPETDPQILEHWGYAHEVHLGKSFQADSCLEMLA